MSVDVPPELQGPVDEAVSRLAAELTERLPEITRGMRAILGSTITELANDGRLLELLGGAIEGNVGTILHMLRHRIAMQYVDVPAAAVAHSRRLAQQGVPVNALIRAYRLGQGYLLEQCYAKLEEHAEDPRLALAVFNEINVRTFAYIDWVSQEVVTVYETERDQWVRNRDAVRVARIKEIVAGRRGSDIAAAETALGYRLRQQHLAAVIWVEESEERGATDNLNRLETAVTAVGRILGKPASVLSCSADHATTWAWFPRGPDTADAAVDQIAMALDSDRTGAVRVALGGVSAGVDGFRDSHLQAVEARRVLISGGEVARRVIGYREPGVAAAALLSHNPEQARVLVRSVLGPLAADDSASARLRETLLGFLACGSSYTATAQRYALHKNSVKYRVERALELRGRPLGDDRIDVELALVACRWLRGSVLGEDTSG